MMIKTSLLACALLMTSAQAWAQDDKPRESKIIYRNVTNTQAYDEKSRGQHVAIKVTPPAMRGPNEFVFVEIYNWTKANLSLIEFDITLHNQQGYDLTTHVSGDEILPKYSGVRKIPAPGTGKFIPITKVTISSLNMVNQDANYVVAPVYVDLVRAASAPGAAKKPAPAAAPASTSAPGPAAGPASEKAPSK